ncbi:MULTISPECIES: SDR family oxidoreductase [Gammaproteobacteria]|uniref:SDR family oxidoreductase n=1 Tax=Gammaproteobacteria TaxID=1236 RepID=UPI000DD0BD31|nr:MULTISPECIES: SDR family oxidoreductase [Gammaproteobacteria]RTE85853.1 SDR family oxidoreductase [Aliidiomarina sp. B3213]TCZ90147.1 SDR family oxidoreductase [Lysobacter sp. N42]
MTERKSIFISGAAAGIGRATALKFLQNGWLVGAYDLDEEGLDKLLVDTNRPDNLITGKLDVTQNSSWQQALEHFTKYTGGALNILFNNAGILLSGPFESNSLEAQQKVIQVNVQGVLAGCYLALPYLAQAAQLGQARVINMSSASAIYGQPSLATYSTSKFAVRGITEALNIEWEGKNIQVMDLMPLFVQTAMVDGMNANSIGRLGVRITPETIATKVFQLSKYQGTKVHWVIGFQTKVAVFLSKISPNWLARFSNKWLAR